MSRGRCIRSQRRRGSRRSVGSGSTPSGTGTGAGIGGVSAAVLALALGEGVPDAPDGHDERRRRGIILDLVAEVADVDVDRLLVLIERLVVAEQLEELAAGVDPPRARREMAEDLELGRGEADPPIASLNAASFEVDHEIAVADDPASRGVAEIAVRSTQEGLDPAHQLAQPERLGQVVVRAELEADHLVDLVVGSGPDEDRRLRAGGAKPAKNLEPVNAGQADIEDDEVGRLVRGELEPLLAALCDGDLVALLLERVLDSARHGELVLDDQDRGTHRGRLYTGSPPIGLARVAASVLRDKVWPASGAPTAPSASRARSTRAQPEVPPRCPPPRRAVSTSPPSRASSSARRSPPSAAAAACRRSSTATASARRTSRSTPTSSRSFAGRPARTP